MSERRVFVVQAPARMVRGEWVEVYDLSAAEEFGRIVRVLGYGNVEVDPKTCYRRFREVMTDFDPELDSVLLVGDPVACARAVHYLGTELCHGAFNVLKWDRREGRYHPYCVG